MSLITILETLLIGPLKLIFEIIFVLAERVIGSSGLAIVALSIVINVLMMPLHQRADAIQEEARDKEAKLRDGIAHIKKTFTGDERMMILQTYYRQNDYKPTDVLNGSVSLLLEVPFFMAAYQFLSNLSMLNGQSFGPIADLGAPDGMLAIGGIVINVLPILMTLINILSGAVYSKGFPLKTKIQMYGLAVFFLVVLYGSPSGLVFYWTMNNLFSLVKNLCRKSPAVRKAGKIILFAVGIAAVIFGLFFYDSPALHRTLIVVAIGVMMMTPLAISLLSGKVKLPKLQNVDKPNNKMFTLAGIFMTVLTGLLIPSNYIAASAQEFVNLSYYHNPMLYILVTVCLAAGFFLVWMRVFYWLANDKAKTLFGIICWILCGIMLMDYMCFGKNLGMIYSNLQFTESPLRFKEWERGVNLIALVALTVIMYVAARKWEQKAVSLMLVATIALGGMSVLNMVTINKDLEGLEGKSQTSGQEIPNFRLSTEGDNVVVIMLDRAMSQVMPYIFNERPDLKEKLDGFVFYENTISFGGFTVFGSTSLVGGYEYTPVEMNKRNEELLRDKHNEALKVMPVLFSQNGYETTVMDPVYANYQWVPDLSIYDEYPEIDAYLTNGVFLDKQQIQTEINANYRNFFCLSIMKCAPVLLQDTIYNQGSYNQAYSPENAYAGQVADTVSVSTGYDPRFMDEYAILCNMETMTNITDEDVNTYMFIDNNITHEGMLLKEPEYIPAEKVDNTAFDAANQDRFTLGDRELNIDLPIQMGHYQANMAALIKLGEWFDYLREQGVYDNTRIIIVSDHGYRMRMEDDLLVNVDGLNEPRYDLGRYNALLMVKDFGSTGFSTSGEFMTNADVPTLSVAGLIENPTNPFTGKLIDNSEKYAHDQIICLSDEWGVVRNDGTTYSPSQWASVKGNIRDHSNWKFLTDYVVLDEHKLP